MPSTLTIRNEFTETADSVDRDWPTKGFTVTTTGDNVIKGKQTIGAVSEAIHLGEVGLGGWWVFANRSTTAGENITLEVAIGTAFAVLHPGEEFPIRLEATVTLRALAAAGTPLLEYWGFDA